MGSTWGLYIPFNIITKTSVPSKVHTEGLPGTPYFEHAICNTDNYNSIGVLLLPIFGFSMATYVSMLGDHVENYATKIQYNADEELLFAWFVDKYGNEVKN